MAMTNAQAQAHANELGHRSPWRRSRKGNLWRYYMGWRVTIFPKGHGYAFCLSPAWADDDGGPTFYPTRPYRTEVTAMAAALDYAVMFTQGDRP